MKNLSLSASQEIDLLMRADRLKNLIRSLGFEQSLHLLAYQCIPDLTPVGLALLGYEVHIVNCDPINTQLLKPYVDMGAVSCDSYPVLAISQKESQTFDVIVIDGVVITELHSDSQLEDMCDQLAATMRSDGLLIITTANFDETLQTKEHVLRPRITDDKTGRHVEIIVRDWHGNGYEYTETRYTITHKDETSTVTYWSRQRRAWRNAELALALTQAGFHDVLWQNDEHYIRLLTAKKQNANRLD